jgi:hypothetical protein
LLHDTLPRRHECEASLGFFAKQAQIRRGVTDASTRWPAVLPHNERMPRPMKRATTPAVGRRKYESTTSIDMPQNYRNAVAKRYRRGTRGVHVHSPAWYG